MNLLIISLANLSYNNRMCIELSTVSNNAISNYGNMNEKTPIIFTSRIVQAIDFWDSSFLTRKKSIMSVEKKYQEVIFSAVKDFKFVYRRMEEIVLCKSYVYERPNYEQLKLLLDKVRSKLPELGEKDRFYAALLLGNYVKTINKGKWILLERESSGVKYFTLAIIYDDQSIFIFLEYLLSFFHNTEISAETYASLPYIKSPGLKLNSRFFKANYSRYILLDN